MLRRPVRLLPAALPSSLLDQEILMTKKLKKLMLLVVALAAVCGVELGLSVPSPEAASGCWQVACNTCCRTLSGGTVCTQRACP